MTNRQAAVWRVRSGAHRCVPVSPLLSIENKWPSAKPKRTGFPKTPGLGPFAAHDSAVRSNLTVLTHLRHEASMPSPFPGMDPYLEGELWGTFHSQLAVKIAHALNPHLAPKYVAFPEKYHNAAAPEEIGITLGAEPVFPDVAV